MSDTVFKIEYGGLGDHLFHTPLPRLLKEAGLADRVYISNTSSVRNIETLQFVWGKNPFLDGFTDLPPTKPNPVHTDSLALMNIVASGYGIPDPGYELYPEIYSDLEILTNFNANLYIDLNYTSFVGALTFIDMLRILKKHPHHIIVNPKLYIRFFYPFRKFILTTSLNQYASLIASCKEFICLASGGATLAAALRKPSIIYFGHGFPDTIRHGINTYVQFGSSSYLRLQLTRILFKRNQLRLKFSKKK
jgi:hypothetical protein